MDTGPTLYYEVRNRESAVIGRHYFCVPYDTARRKDYALHVLDGGSLFAVYERSTPHCLSVIYDKKTGEHYPCAGECAPLPPMAPYDHLHPVRDRLIGRVKKLTGDKAYKLADQYILGRDN